MLGKERKRQFVGLNSLFEEDRPLSPREMSDPRLTGKLGRIIAWPVREGEDPGVDRIRRRLAARYVRDVEPVVERNEEWRRRSRLKDFIVRAGAR